MKFAFLPVIALMFLICPVANAHEIGTTRVSVTFTESASYNIEVGTDAISLVEKLSGQTPPPDANSGMLQSQLREFDELFRRRVVVAFDGSAVNPEINYSVSGVVTVTSSPVATIHLKGSIPQNARQFAWTYSWTFATYSLTVADSHETQTTEWLGGRKTGKLR